MKSSIVLVLVIGVAIVVAQIPISGPKSQADCEPNYVFNPCQRLPCRPDGLCPMVCIPACECPAGQVFDAQRNCVEAPPTQSMFNRFKRVSVTINLHDFVEIPECGPNQVYSTCKNNCPPVCGQEELMCTAQCVSEGCQCNPGLFIKGDDCVVPDQCKRFVVVK